MVTEEININEFYWGIKTKFKLEIGLKNKLTGQYAAGEGSTYPDIVWFPQGTFIVTTFNTSIGTNSCTISLSGKDKMCMLNGELGGQLFASIDFGTEETLTKKMQEVTGIDNVSSDTLMANTYYKRLSAEEYPKDNNDDYLVILSTDNIYTFAPAADGDYYKNGNHYCYITEDVRTTTKYAIYKLITNPDELFIPSTAEGWENNYYYYQKFPNYYILDQAVHASADRDYYTLTTLYVEDYLQEKVQIPLEKIIREAVHAYAKEPYHNIVINDLDDYGLEQLTYKGDRDLYALRNRSTGHFTQLAFAGTNPSLDNCVADSEFQFDSLTQEVTSVTGTALKLENRIFRLATAAETANENEEGLYTVAKIVYGDDIGYRITDLVYTGDLISALGDTLTSVLDKIKTMLGDFEYFYDLQGRFVFQRKRTYVNTSWSQLTDSGDETYVDYVNSDRKKFSFNFEGNRLLSAIQNSPVLTNLKNDFSVWGKRKTISGTEVPIHARYAIDKKPVYYKALNGKVYTVDEQYAMEQLNITYDVTPNLIYERIKNFSLQYSLPSSLSLTPPTQRANGSWEPGWWDIRDWARYYEALTGEQPNGTMKFYSRGDETGCIPIRSFGGDYASTPANDCAWLIEYRDNVQQNGHYGYINFGHGRGVYGGQPLTCTYYVSVENNGTLTTTATDIKKDFVSPYRFCADTHTYSYFLKQINDSKDNGGTEHTFVYFYNPDFPNVSYEELVEQKLEEAYNEWKSKNQVYIVDWREILYQMALDYFAGQGCSVDNPIYLAKTEEDEHGDEIEVQYTMTDPDHFLYEVGIRNPYYFPTGYTGYEQYYTDIQGFWRQLYNPEYIPVAKYEIGIYEDKPIQAEGSVYYTKTKEWQETLLSDFDFDFYVDSTDTNVAYWYTTLLNEINHADSSTEEGQARIKKLTDVKNKFEQYRINPIVLNNDANAIERKKRLYWSTNVFEAPETLNFWIEFLDSGTELAQFAVPMVGDRSKTVNEDKARAIIYKEIPDVILYDVFDAEGTGPDYSRIRQEITEKSGYTFIYLPKGFAKYLNISYRSMSVKNKVDELLYQFAYCIENITLTAIPIYYLEPNTRIYVQDKTTQINGEYIVNKLTLPLTYNGTMSITAAKAPERLY